MFPPVVCACLLSLCLAAHARALPTPPDSAKAAIGGDFAGLQARLARWIKDAEAGAPGATDRAKFAALLEDPVFRRVLAQHEVLRAAGADALRKTFPDAVKRSADAAFLHAFLADTEWMEAWLGSGPVGSAEGLGFLRDIFASDPGAEKHRELATAVALVFSAEPTAPTMRSRMLDPDHPTTPVGRYRFYREAQAAGRLHPLFDRLRTWELRFVVGGRQSRDDASLAWMLEHVHLPLSKYADACWMVEYRGANAFGDTIQGPDYYKPWNKAQCWAQNVHTHGGVCGTLSTFGSLAAQAHGIPSYTCGQPGHCAYAVRLARGQWVGGFGGPAGGPHNWFWGESYYYILLMEDAFADDAAMAASQRGVWLARLHGAGKNVEERAKAYAALDLALSKRPTDFDAWNALVDLQLGDPAVTQEAWQATARRAFGALRRHTRPLADLLARFADEKILKGADDAQKTAWFLEVQRAIAATDGPLEWDWNMTAYFKGQADALTSSAARWNLFKQVLPLHAGRRHFFDQLLAYGTEAAKDEKDPTVFVTAVATGLGHSGDALTKDMRRQICARLLLAAEQARSADAFRAAAALLRDRPAPPEGPALVRPAGLRLLSADAMLRPSSTSSWDDPCAHPSVLTEAGGFFHTDAETNPNVVVELKATARLAGILVVNRPGFEGRLCPFTVSTSTDGATWKPCFTATQPEAQWYIPLDDKNLSAKWIKVESSHAPDKDHLHLRNLCVYGKAAE